MQERKQVEVNRQAVEILQKRDREILERAVDQGLKNIKEDSKHPLHQMPEQLIQQLRKEVNGEVKHSPGDSKRLQFQKDFAQELGASIYESEVKHKNRSFTKEERDALSIVIANHANELLNGKKSTFVIIEKELKVIPERLKTLEKQLAFLDKNSQGDAKQVDALIEEINLKEKEKTEWEVKYNSEAKAEQRGVGNLTGKQFKTEFILPHLRDHIDRVEGELDVLRGQIREFKNASELLIEKKKLQETLERAERLKLIKNDLQEVARDLQTSLRSQADAKTIRLLSEFNQILQQANQNVEEKPSMDELYEPATEWLRSYLRPTPNQEVLVIREISNHIAKQYEETALEQEYNSIFAKKIAQVDRALDKEPDLSGNVKLKAQRIYEDHCKFLQLEGNQKNGIRAIEKYLETGTFKHPANVDIDKLKHSLEKPKGEERSSLVHQPSSLRRPSTLSRAGTRSRLGSDASEKEIIFSSPDEAFKQGYNETFKLRPDDEKNIGGGKEFFDAYSKGREVGVRHFKVQDSKPNIQKGLTEWRQEKAAEKKAEKSKLLRSKSSLGKSSVSEITEPPQAIPAFADVKASTSAHVFSKLDENPPSPAPTRRESAQVFSHPSAAAPSAAPGPASAVAASGNKYEVPPATESQGDSKPSIDKTKRKSASADQEVMPGQVNVNESAHASAAPGDAKKHRKILTAVPEDTISPLPDVTASSHKRKTMTRNVPTLDASGQVRRPSEIASGKSASESSPADSRSRTSGRRIS